LSNSKLFDIKNWDISVLNWYKEDKICKASGFIRNWDMLTQFKQDRVLESSAKIS